MADLSALINATKAVIKENGAQEITGNILQYVLVNIINTLNDVKQDIDENTLQTAAKTIAGAINELYADKQNITDNALLTAAKTIVGAINEVRSTANAAQPKTDNTLETAAKTIAAAINEVNTIAKAAQPKEDGKGLSENDFTDTYKQMVENAQPKTDDTLQTTSKTIPGAINEVNTLAKNAQPKETGKGLSTNDYTTEDKEKVANALLKTQQTLTEAEQAQVQENIAPGGYSRDYLVSVGLTYNEATNDYSLNGISGIPYDEACRIASLRLFGKFLYGAISYDTLQARTNLMPNNVNTASLSLELFSYNNPTIEVIALSKGGCSVVALNGAFYKNIKLRKILAPFLDVASIPAAGFNATFEQCAIFEGLNLKNLKQNISISDSPLWKYEYLKYTIDNAANTSAITITVHPTTYSYLDGSAQPTPEVGGTTAEWQALVTEAQGKQISFASA